MKRQLISIVGWYGVLAILAAYILVTNDILSAKSLPYQLLNLTGAVGIAVVAASRKDKQPVVLNIIWAIIAAVAIVQIIVN